MPNEDPTVAFDSAWQRFQDQGGEELDPRDTMALSGTMAFQVAMNAPTRFAGVLSLCGPFPRRNRPFACLNRSRRVPAFLAVGRDSREYPVADACEDLRLLHTAGLQVALGQYPCGQELTPDMLANVDRWIMRQITPGADTEPTSGESWSC